MSMIENERTKLTATALNNVSVATVVTGFIAPASSFIYGFAQPTSRFWWTMPIACISAGTIPHLVARQVLRRMVP